MLTAAFVAAGFFSQFGDVTRVRVSRNPKVRARRLRRRSLRL